MMVGIRMTTSSLYLRSPARGATPRAGVRADPLAAALVVAVALGVLALWIALAAATRPAADGSAAGRVAIVVDAAGRPGAALDAATAAARSDGRPTAAVRVPRSRFEAAADVRYFAAQRYETVVVVGPAARAAARALSGAYPRTRFVLRARLPQRGEPVRRARPWRRAPRLGRATPRTARRRGRPARHAASRSRRRLSASREGTRRARAGRAEFCWREW